MTNLVANFAKFFLQNGDKLSMKNWQHRSILNICHRNLVTNPKTNKKIIGGAREQNKGGTLGQARQSAAVVCRG